jgi:hypothetical protein
VCVVPFYSNNLRIKNSGVRILKDSQALFSGPVCNIVCESAHPPGILVGEVLSFDGVHPIVLVLRVRAQSGLYNAAYTVYRSQSKYQ